MSPKIYRFAITFFLVLSAVALTALYHVVEESVFLQHTYGNTPVDMFPIVSLLLVGVTGSVTFVALKKKSKTDA